ncbi:hypothetical protein ACFOLJ_04440 [Rugamonas sp. CCM 8940]|uniref:hypothetical protein n=1 Tax=Rugamonas sp. CCM 8940 TaxID=2765359 RepID=UPI0018F31A11|nr:hypothetical protein [Rugamonas sp. CCM 8940]MBJ7314090.1 hypothetical protein [Rugamonas sp. CCM 8940]
MSPRLVIVVSALAIISLADAADKKAPGRYLATPLKGDYYVYGGTMAEMLPPTAKDRKVSFMVNGQLAKDLFNQIGPDAKHACSAETGYHERRKGDLVCILDEDGYSCYFGLDVTIGKSTYGVIC